MLLYASPRDVAWAITSVSFGDNRVAFPDAVVFGRGFGTLRPRQARISGIHRL